MPSPNDSHHSDATLTHAEVERAQREGKESGDSEKTVIRERNHDNGNSPSGSRPSYQIGWHTSAEDLLGQQLDHFRIDSLVGIGGMGAVFRGEDIRLNREVAIKAIPTAGRDPESMRRFRFEAQSAAKLDHPNIARVYYVGETPDWSYIVFEFVEGINLRETVIRQGPMSVEQSVYLIRQVSQALQHASQRQVVHRDIKPSNIVLTPSGQAKIVDMGLARATELDRSTNDLTASGVTLGTFDYISPEQAHDPREADVRSDIYSLGCTWYYLLTGLPPFPDGTALQKLLMHGSKMPEDPRVHRHDLSDSLIAILRKMIAKRPSDRYQQPADLIDDLQTLAVLEDLSWTRDTDPRESLPPSSSSWSRLAIPYLVALGGVTSIAIWLQSEGSRHSQFTIPEVHYGVPIKTDGSSLQLNKSPDSGQVLSVPAEAGTVVVDPQFNSEQLETNRQLAVSLDQAIERVNLTPDANRIVIQSSTIRSASNLRALSRNHGKLSIESKPGSRARIEIDISESEASDSRAWLDCGSSQITLVGCDIVWRAQSVRQALLICRSGSQLNLIDCTISIEPPIQSTVPVALLQAPMPVAIRCEAGLPLSSGENVSVAPSVLLNFKDIVLTGHGDAIQIIAPIRVEGKINNSLFALSGSLLHLPRVNMPLRGNSRVLLYMQNVTSWTARSFLYASWVSGSSPPLPVTRSALDSVFGGMESLVYWDVAADEDWQFWERSEQGEELARWLDFRGEDNCYDELTKQLVEVRLRNGMSEELPFTGEARLLKEERGVESAIPWKQRPSHETLFSPQDLIQFELHESNFPRGANIQQLIQSRSRSD